MSNLSYCSYLVHFRVILELNFREQFRNIINGSVLDLNSSSSSSWFSSTTSIIESNVQIASRYIYYLPKLWIVAVIISLTIAIMLRNIELIGIKYSKSFPIFINTRKKDN